MSIIVICPSCGEENYGSALYCQKCQASLVGVPRQNIPDLEISSPGESAASVTNQEENRKKESLELFEGTYSMMLKSIRSWGTTLLILGAIHVFTNGFLSAPYGVVLIIVGLGSFLFKSSSMFVIYAVTLLWAAISNIISLNVAWIGMGLIQVFMAYRVFKQFQVYGRVEAGLKELTTNGSTPPGMTSDRAARFFPWLGSILGCSSIIFFAILFVVVVIIVVGSNGLAPIPDYFGFMEGLLVNLAVLGASIGLASLLSKYKYKPLAILGMVGGILTILIEFAIPYLF